ncbi:MAG: adenylate/guanylate cyclase domain-containing protein [Chloroflexi bacterium]|nr:adenylate/guanylate cyclase domain-containing protein [Chloroflexota bacterium]
MTTDPMLPPPSPNDEMWRTMLLRNPRALRNRRIHLRIPSSPRCKACAAPFAGVGGILMPLLGHGRWAKNPKYCVGCFSMLRANHGGAEVECSLLFADVRGSTALAEQMPPKEFNRLMGWFFDVASDVLVSHDAFVDKFVGDEIIGIFVPAMATDAHAKRAVDAAVALMQRTLRSKVGGRSIPIGAGVSTGIAYVGSIGMGRDTELTAMGDMVNTTARLASAAGAGEILVTEAAAAAAGLPSSLERRSLQLKGKSGPTEVAVLTMTAPASQGVDM